VGSNAGGYDAEGRWWGLDHGPDHEHRSVGSRRSWCLACGEWCYPDALCVRCAAAPPSDATELDSEVAAHVLSVAERSNAHKSEPT
jgi:hypothetical protein